MYVEELRLTDFRAIRECAVSFVHPMSEESADREFPNVNVLLGTNGGGKSTLLQGIAAAILTPSLDPDQHADEAGLADVTAGVPAQTWPRIGGTRDCSAYVTLRLEGVADQPLQKIVCGFVIERATRNVSSTAATPWLGQDIPVFGYGAFRSTSEHQPADNSDGGRWRRVASLFSSQGGLLAPEPWLPDAVEERPEFLEILNLLMPPETSTEGEVRDGRLVVRSRGLNVPRTHLSDGAQTYLAWLFDLLYRLHRRAGDVDLRDAAAVVLVDEIDQRMHPSWQQSLLSRLSGSLPRVQFIGAAHSPLLAAGLRAENLTLLEPDLEARSAGAMRATRLQEDLFGRTADGVLTSSYFQIGSPRSERFQQQLRDLAREAEDSDESALGFMQRLTAGSIGELPRGRTPTRERPNRMRGRRS